jgi:hypothetical protein
MHAQSIRPSRAWYWVSAAFLVGAVALIVLAVVSGVSMISMVNGFQRVKVPGQAEVTFAEPGGYTLYFEGPGISDAADTPTVHIDLEATSPGPPPSMNDYVGDVTYSLSGHEGRAVATIQIPQPGTYLLSAGEPTGPGVTDVAVGRGATRSIVNVVVFGLIAFLLLLPAGLAIGIVTAVRRRRARRAQLTPQEGWPLTFARAAAVAGWYPDPAGRHEHRFWDGARWTDNVVDHGVRGVDPLGEPTLSTAASEGAPATNSSQRPQDAQRPQV